MTEPAAPPTTDPWAAVDAAATRSRSGVVPMLVAAVVGAAGPALRVLPNGTNGSRGAAVLVGLGLATALVGSTRVLAVRVGGLALVTALGMAAAHRTVGAVPALLTVAATLVVLTVASGRWPWSTGRGRDLAPSTLAVLPAAAAGIAWERGAPWAVHLGLLALAVAVALVQRGRRWPVEAAIERGITRAASAIGAAGLFVASVPLLWIPGVPARVAERVRTRAPRWSGRAATVGDLRRDARYPFASAEPRERRLRTASGLLLVLAATVGTVVWIRSRPASEVRVDPHGRAVDAELARKKPWSERPAGAGVPWADEVQREQATQVLMSPGPVGGYALGRTRTRYTNVEDGRRVTLDPPACRCKHLKVWFFGGSAVFGIGQRDKHTIASNLVREAAADDVALDVDNMGVPGYTLWQEYQALLNRLATTDDRPDLVVFYDGFNDLAQTYLQTIVYGARWDRPVVFDPEVFRKLSRVGPGDVAPAERRLGDPGAFGRRAAGRYQRLKDVVAAFLAESHIPAVFTFQADVLVTTYERGKVVPPYMWADIDNRVAAPLDTALQMASQQLEDQGDNLRRLFEHDPRPVFWDITHVNEAGARTVASALYRQLRPRIFGLLQGSS